MKVLSGLIFSILLTTGTAARADLPGTHGMVVFGGGTATYASHLPMFHAPHDRQVILKVTFENAPGSKALETYESAKHADHALFTLEPETMDLEKIVNGTKTSFIASIYDGHFEKEGENLGQLKVKIEKVVFSSKLNSQAVKPDFETYFLFGEKGQYFAAHLIQAKPSFDAIVQVSQPYELFQPACRTRVCAEPVKTPIEDEKLPLTLAGPNNVPDLKPMDGGYIPQLGEAFSGIADVLNVVYSEVGDLSH